MWPRLAVFIAPVDRESGLYRVTLRKGWWAGPGHGGQGAVLREIIVSLKATDEVERVREALRAAADSL